MPNTDYVFSILTHILYIINETWTGIKYKELTNEVIKIAEENNFEEDLIEYLRNYFPKGVEETKKEIQKLKNTSIHLPAKPLKLKEATEYSKKEFDDLFWNYQEDFYEEDKDTGFTSNEEGRNGDAIVAATYRATQDWTNINYEELKNEIINLSKIHKMEKERIEQALSYIPKDVKETKVEIQKLKDTSTHLPIKKLKL
jgi:hypothetical protein